jgi:hypothetical protein
MMCDSSIRAGQIVRIEWVEPVWPLVAEVHALNASDLWVRIPGTVQALKWRDIKRVEVVTPAVKAQPCSYCGRPMSWSAGAWVCPCGASAERLESGALDWAAPREP